MERPLLHDPLDAALAGAALAGLALAAIDRQTVLEIAERAVRASVVAQRRAARLDRLFEHLANVFTSCPACAGRPSAPAARAIAGAEQRLADIDVAKPGDDALVEQRRLYRLPPPGERASSWAGVERAAERLRAEPLEPGVLIQLERCRSGPCSRTGAGRRR